MGVCDVAADYHAFEERRRLLDEDHHRTELLNLGRRTHSSIEIIGHRVRSGERRSSRTRLRSTKRIDWQRTPLPVVGHERRQPN